MRPLLPEQTAGSLFKTFFLSLATFIIILPSTVLADTSVFQQLQTPFYDPGSSTANSCSGSTTLVGTDHVQQALNFLLGKGLTLNQAAGVIGNLEQESGQGLDPTDDQNKGTASTPTPNDGFGIAQWTDPGRQQGLVALAQKEGVGPDDLGAQLDYLWQELSGGYASVLQNLKASTSVEDATNQFMGPDNAASGKPVSPTAEVARSGGYENPGIPAAQNRVNNALAVAQTYGGTSSGSGSSDNTCSANGAVSCNGGSATNGSNGGLSQVRQTVVCLAQQELSTWKSQPGYPWSGENNYSETGFLKYSQNRSEEWCADFATWVYNQAGYPLNPDPNWNIAYVPDIQSVGEQDGNFHWHDGSSGYIPKPGDLAIHGSTHVNIFISAQGGVAQYIGGDQGNGPYPGGSVVSIETGSGYYDNGITGYVSPD